MSYISHLLLALRMLCKGCYRSHRFPVDVRNRFKYASCERVLLKAEKRNFLFQEYPGYMQTGALIFCDGIHFFSNSYRNGSIIAEFKLTFKTSLTAKEAMAPLKQEIADGKLGSLEVDPNSLRLKDINQGKWVEPWIHGISRLNIYIWSLSVALPVSKFLPRPSTQWKWVVTFVDSIRLYMVIDMISQLRRHSLYQFIIGCEDSKRFPTIHPRFS